MRVQVDPHVCQGHTLCAIIAPATFELDDIDGHAQAGSGDVPIDEQARHTKPSAPAPSWRSASSNTVWAAHTR
ncbi:ferredoxin [Gordonia sp. DT218]|uniref:ferredoxin n=1 Tax=Gordonia sp. DT218 TaxID=3416659 RepID=UPI003CEC0A1E